MNILNRIKNQTKLPRKRATHQLKILLNYHFKRQARRPVFIVATKRSGSNLLLDYLRSIPRTSFFSEILNPDMYDGIRADFISKKAVLRHILYSIHSCPQVTCGAKLMVEQLVGHRISAGDVKALFPSVQWIVLYRHCFLEQFVSLKIAERSNRWECLNDLNVSERLDIDPVEFEVFCRKIKENYKYVLGENWRSNFSCVLSYEELAEDSKKVFDAKIFPLLKIPPSSIRSRTKKQNTEPMREVVSNYEDIQPMLLQPWARW